MVYHENHIFNAKLFIWITENIYFEKLQSKMKSASMLKMNLAPYLDIL